jgi:hypothetical protein
MRRNLVWISITTLVVISCFFAARRLTTHRIARANITVVPFVLQLDNYNFDTDPNGKLFHKRVFARRSDGASANVETVGLLSWGKTTRKVTYPDGRWVTVYDLIGAKTSWQLKPSSLARMKRLLQEPPPDCVFQTEGDPKVISTETILGQKVFVVQAASTSWRETAWRAPGLACQELKFRFESRQPDGSFKLKSEERPVGLTIGEPPPSLFDSGPSFEEQKPSDAHRHFFEKLPIPEDDATKKESEQMDMDYETQKR